VCISILCPDRAVKPSYGRSRDRSPESPSGVWIVSSECGELLEGERAVPSLEIQAMDGGGGPRIGPGSRCSRRPWQLDRSIGIQRRTAAFRPGERDLGTRVLLECPGTSLGWTGRPDGWRGTAPRRSDPGLSVWGLEGSGEGPRPSVSRGEAEFQAIDWKKRNALRPGSIAEYDPVWLN